MLHVVHYPVFGGPHNQALRLAEPLSRRGWQTVAVVPDGPGNAANRLREGGVDVVQLPLGRLRAIPDPRVQIALATGMSGEVRHIRRLIRERQIDLVVIGGLVNPHAAIAARVEGVPVVWQLLDTRSPMGLRLLLMPLVTRLADAIMSTGMGVARVHRGATSLGARLVPFFPPVDTSVFRPDGRRRAAARAELGVPDGASVIGTVGNLNPQKGHEYLLRAAALIRSTRSEVVIRVLGAHTPTQAAYERSLREEARALELTEPETLAFVDAGARVAELLPAFDIFLLTSVPRSEGVPTVILEAMACGIPVVATDVGAVREVVEDGVTGFVVPPLDPRALADATLRLLNDRELRSRMGAVARQRAVEHYDVEVCADVHVRAFEAAVAHRRRQTGANAEVQAAGQSPPDLRSLLVCPGCKGTLAWANGEAGCEACHRVYPVVDGIPVMLLDRAAAEHDEIDHTHGHAHKKKQAAFFDRELEAEFEITRPHGTPRLYRWLLAQKFSQSIAGVQTLLPGGLALTVCGGSGMDAEFLARAGARVISSDISLGAARRTAERAQRYALPIVPLVADVEHLPFSDESIDLVYVHDGLHHLEEPLAGVGEMARVAARAVSLTEPARAVVTRLAVKFGLALEREQAGNRVARVTPLEVAMALRDRGFAIHRARRYGMYYSHVPGRLFALCSKRGMFHVIAGAWHIGNALVGGWGNKCVVVGLRRSRHP